MAKSLYPWTEAAEIQIVAAIRAGAFPYVAAEAAGIPREVFLDWISRGSSKHPCARFRKFHDKVRQAIAHARLKAEAAALKEDPAFWLKYGPGKETAGIPGWSNAVKPPTAEEAETKEGEIRLGTLGALTPEMGRLAPEMREAILTALGQPGSHTEFTES